MQISTLPGIIQKNARQYPNFAAQYSKDESGVYRPTSYAELYSEILSFAAGLRDAGIRRRDHVGLISENRKEWLVISFALHCLGAVDVPRGCGADAAELAYILSFGDCKTAVLENKSQLDKLLSERDNVPLIERLIIIDDDFDKEPYQANLRGIKLFGCRDIMEKGKSLTAEAGGVKSIEAEIDLGRGDDLASIIFTSGTTGQPKGVMLSHRNFLHQSSLAPLVVDNKPGDIWLTCS